MRQKDKISTPLGVLEFLGVGVSYICRDLNDMYMHNGSSISWKNNCFQEIANNYNEYISLLKVILRYIDMIYNGEKGDGLSLKPGIQVQVKDQFFELIRINDKKDKVYLKRRGEEEEKEFSIYSISNMKMNYFDAIDKETIALSHGYSDFYSKIYDDIINFNSYDIDYWTSLIKIDFIGHGFPQYSEVTIPEIFFGSQNLDQYLSKGLPMHSKLVDLNGLQPKLWFLKVPEIMYNYFFVIRIKTMFSIKPGCEPFVRYRDFNDDMRFPSSLEINENHNAINDGWSILKTSDIFDIKTGKSYKKYKADNGDILDADVILTLGKDDYYLFLQRYDIKKLEILDGCYFI